MLTNTDAARQRAAHQRAVRGARRAHRWIILLAWASLASVFSLPDTLADDDRREPSLEDRCRDEVLDLHQFFADWFNGDIANDEATFARLEKALADDFEIIGPDGRLTTRGDLLPILARAHGGRKALDFSIEVKHPKARKISDALCLITYEEWQSSNQGNRAWRSTAVLRRQDDAPGGVVWLHVHETYLPDD